MFGSSMVTVPLLSRRSQSRGCGVARYTNRSSHSSITITVVTGDGNRMNRHNACRRCKLKQDIWPRTFNNHTQALMILRNPTLFSRYLALRSLSLFLNSF